MLSYILSSDYYKSKYQSTLKTVEAVLSCSIKYPSSVYVKNICHYAVGVLWSQTLVQASSLTWVPRTQTRLAGSLGQMPLFSEHLPSSRPDCCCFLTCLFSLFLSCFWKVAGMLQGWRADSENWEMSGVVLHDVKYPPIKKLYFLNVIWFSFFVSWHWCYI